LCHVAFSCLIPMATEIVCCVPTKVTWSSESLNSLLLCTLDWVTQMIQTITSLSIPSQKGPSRLTSQTTAFGLPLRQDGMILDVDAYLDSCGLSLSDEFESPLGFFLMTEWSLLLTSASSSSSMMSSWMPSIPKAIGCPSLMNVILMILVHVVTFLASCYCP
jgi:hypothetical protein